MRHFNTAGPIRSDLHYQVPPLARIDRDGVLGLIRQEKYFVLHAPRQTGKTSALLALRDLLNGGTVGEYRCVYANVEVGQSARENTHEAMRAILGELASWALETLDDGFVDGIRGSVLDTHGPAGALGAVLNRWSQAAPRPLVLMLDEIDALVGDTLIAVLRQLRAGYPRRPTGFPQSVILCGVRDVRDYRIHSRAEKAVITGGSAFNIKAESLRLGDFCEDEVRFLLAEHTEETGQAFTDEAQGAVWALTRGQPWLVNALAYEACFRNRAGRVRANPITAGAIEAAREALILRRDTHLDQLTDKLREERVQQVVEPLLSGTQPVDDLLEDDLQYVRDLGLVAQSDPVSIANPIYQEVIPRTLSYTMQARLPQNPAWYVGEDGRLRMAALLRAFQAFFREHSEHWVERFQYREAGPQLLLQAFLQRIVNSGGRIEREYGLGRRRVDLLVVWPVAGGAEASGLAESSSTQRVVVECKVLYGTLERTLREGLEQTRAYMDLSTAEQGHLVVFDRTTGKAWEEKIFVREEAEGGAPVMVWGM